MIAIHDPLCPSAAGALPVQPSEPGDAVAVRVAADGLVEGMERKIGLLASRRFAVRKVGVSSRKNAPLGWLVEWKATIAGPLTDFRGKALATADSVEFPPNLLATWGEQRSSTPIWSAAASCVSLGPLAIPGWQRIS
jgi:hypothetical protein